MPTLRSGRLLVLLLLSAVLAPPARAVLPPGDSVQTMRFGGLDRRYLLHVPASYDGSQAVPLVLDFHGLSSNATQQKSLSGWVRVSDREGFLVAHPDGVNNAWNAGLCCGNMEVDDVNFIRAVVVAIASGGNVDLTRVYATGLSNGGAISQRLACDAADLFAATAPMAFPVPARPLSECRPARPIPVLTFMGLTDVLVEYDGGLFPSAPATFAFWHDVDGCRGSAPDQTVVQGQSRCEYYTSCADGVEAGLCSITAQSFTGPLEYVSGHILYANPDFVLADVAWDFLKRFTLPEMDAPIVVEMAGDDILRLGRGKSDKLSVVWELTLGDGTWGLRDGNGFALGGSARGNGRRRTLTLSSDAIGVLGSALAPRAAALAGQAVDVTPRSPGKLKAVVARGKVRLTGRLRLARGTLKLKLSGGGG